MKVSGTKNNIYYVKTDKIQGIIKRFIAPAMKDQNFASLHCQENFILSHYKKEKFLLELNQLIGFLKLFIAKLYEIQLYFQSLDRFNAVKLYFSAQKTGVYNVFLLKKMNYCK